MAQLDVRNLNNEVVGSVDIDDNILAADINTALIHEVVLMQLANRRSGTHMTKTKGNVAGGGRKPWKQKGSGRARSGSIRSPLWRGGGVIFGPLPKDYSYTMPKKKIKTALKSILSAKYADNAITVIEDLELPEYKTKLAAAALKRFDASRGVLILINDSHARISAAYRNIPFVEFLHINGLNVYDLVKARRIFILKDCIDALKTRVGGGEA
jgi:large subunit ribosomal protein L4